MSDFVIYAGMSVNAVLTNGNSNQKHVAKMFDANNDGVYDVNEAALFNSSQVQLGADSVNINFGSNKVVFNGDYNNYKIRNTEDKTKWDYSILNTKSGSIIAFDKQVGNATSTTVKYNAVNNSESVSIENYANSNNFLNSYDGVYIAAGNSDNFDVNVNNSKIDTINTINSNNAIVKVNKAFGDGYGFTDGTIIQTSNQVSEINNSNKIVKDIDDNETSKKVVKTTNSNLFFGKKFINSFVENF